MEMLTNEPLVHAPNLSKYLFFNVDEHNIGVGAVLQQLGEDGSLHLVCSEVALMSYVLVLSRAPLGPVFNAVSLISSWDMVQQQHSWL